MMRAGTFEKGVDSAENAGRLYEQAYGRGYRGRSPGFAEDYEDSQKDIIANSFRLRAAQEESKAHQYAAAADYLKTIEAQRLENQGNAQTQKIKGQYDLAGSQVEGQYSLFKQDLANRGIMEKTLVDNEYENVRKNWDIQDNQYREHLKEQGLNQRAVFDKEMQRVLKGMEIEGNLKNTIIEKQMDRETALAREEIISRDNQMRMAKELYDNPETQFAWVEFQKAMKEGNLDKAAKVYSVGKLYAPNVRQTERGDKLNKERLDFEYRQQQDVLQQLNKDREFGLSYQKENREAITQTAANFINYQELMQKLDKSWNEKINDPMLKPEEKQALVNDSRLIGPAIQATERMAHAQSQDEFLAAQQELSKYVNQASPQARLYIQQRAKIGSLMSNSEKELYKAYGLNIPADPSLMEDAQQEEGSRIGGAITGTLGFLRDAVAAPFQVLQDLGANDYYNTEPERVNNLANSVMRYNFRAQGFRGSQLDKKVNNLYNSLDHNGRIKYIKDNASVFEKIMAATHAKNQANPAAQFTAEQDRDLSMGILSLATGMGVGKIANKLAVGALSKGVKTPQGQALLQKLTGYFSKREQELLASPGKGFTPWQAGEPQVPSSAGTLANEIPEAFTGFRPTAGPQPFGPSTPPGLNPNTTIAPPLSGQSLQVTPPMPGGFMGGTQLRGSAPTFRQSIPTSAVKTTAGKLSMNEPVSFKEAKFVVEELKVNPQAAYEVPDVQNAVKAGMPPEEAVAQWTTKLLQNAKRGVTKKNVASYVSAGAAADTAIKIQRNKF